MLRSNWFAKVFTYLHAHKLKQDWRAVALFENSRTKPKRQIHCDALIHSQHTRRIYLDELTIADAATPGLTLLKLVTVPLADTPPLVE